MNFCYAAACAVASVLVFAQSPPVDGISGSGWVGAGLLGAVLSWVFLVHLPAKDKRDKEKDEAHAVTVTAMVADAKEDRRQYVAVIASMEEKFHKRADADDARLANLLESFGQREEAKELRHKAELNDQRQYYEAKITKLERMLEDSLNSDRRAVHDVANLGQKVIRTVEVAAAEAQAAQQPGSGTYPAVRK